MQKISEILGYQPIDMHAHFDHGVPGDRAEKVDPAEAYAHLTDLKTVKAEYDSVGICAGAFSTFSSVTGPDRIVLENQYLYELSQKTGWIYQWVVVNPEQPQTYEQAKKMLASPKTLGVKLHPGMHKYSMETWGNEIFSFANELGAVVLIHPLDVSAHASLANQYPNMKLILAHIHKLEDTDAILAAKHGNIYVDTSGGSSSLNNVIEHAVARVGAEKILFGTDTYAAGFQVGRVAWARIPDADKRLILRDNIRNLFPGVFD